MLLMEMQKEMPRWRELFMDYLRRKTFCIRIQT